MQQSGNRTLEVCTIMKITNSRKSYLIPIKGTEAFVMNCLQLSISSSLTCLNCTANTTTFWLTVFRVVLIQ